MHRLSNRTEQPFCLQSATLPEKSHYVSHFSLLYWFPSFCPCLKIFGDSLYLYICCLQFYVSWDSGQWLARLFAVLMPWRQSWTWEMGWVILPAPLPRILGELPSSLSHSGFSFQLVACWGRIPGPLLAILPSHWLLNIFCTSCFKVLFYLVTS